MDRLISYCGGCEVAEELAESIMDDVRMDFDAQPHVLRGGVPFAGYGISAV